jgi:hypothetical protein
MQSSQDLIYRCKFRRCPAVKFTLPPDDDVEPTGYRRTKKGKKHKKKNRTGNSTQPDVTPTWPTKDPVTPAPIDEE